MLQEVGVLVYLWITYLNLQVVLQKSNYISSLVQHLYLHWCILPKCLVWSIVKKKKIWCIICETLIWKCLRIITFYHSPPLFLPWYPSSNLKELDNMRQWHVSMFHKIWRHQTNPYLRCMQPNVLYEHGIHILFNACQIYHHGTVDTVLFSLVSKKYICTQNSKVVANFFSFLNCYEPFSFVWIL